MCIRDSLGSPHTEFADVLREALAPSSSPATVPEFDRKRIPHPEITRIEPKVADPLANSQAWWRQAAAAPADGTSASGQPERTPRVGTGWLRSHQAPLPPIEVVRPSRASKLIGLLLIAMGLLSAAALGTLSNLLLGGLVLLMWGAAMMTGAWVLWNRTDPVVKRSAARRQVKLARRELDRQEARVAEARNARSSLDGKERRDLQALESRRSKLPKSATDEYERKSKDLRKSVTALQDALKRLDAAKAAELRQQLKASQEKHIQNYLASRLIKPGVIHGIGPAMVAALAANGIHTAADLAAVSGTQFRRTGSSYWFTISGIGPAKAAAIHSWHQLQLTAAQSRAPQWLSSTQTKAIETKFADEKRTTQAAIDAVGPKLHALKTAIDAKYTAEDQEITQKIELVRLDYRHRRSAADATVAQVVTQLQKLEDELSDAQRNLDRYQSVSFLKYLSA